MSKVFAGFEGFITTDKLTESQVIIIKWQYGYFGSFYKKMFEAITLADDTNIARIEKGFPELVKAFNLYKTQFGFFDECERLAEKFSLNK
jgi:hypothetical protein